MWICKKCQNQNEENFRFCWSCGFSKAASRKTVSGNTTELTFNKNTESAEEEIPQVKELQSEPRREEIRIEKDEPIEVEVRTLEEPEVYDDSEVLTHHKPVKSNPRERADRHDSELFSTFASVNKSKSEDELDKIDWQKEIFSIATRLVGLYFIFLVILALPDIFGFIHDLIYNANSLEGHSISQLLLASSPVAKYLFYLAIGMYLISSGKLLLRLLPAR